MTSSAAQDGIKFTRPKVLLIDVDADAHQALKAAGYSVLDGTFGCPYEVPVSDKFSPVITNGSLPETFGEQEIVVVDLVPLEILSEPSGQKATSPGSDDWYGSCSTGQIDPRPRLMAFARKRFDEIVYSGGVVIIFADSRWSQQLKLGYIEPGYKGFQEKAPLPFDNWDLLSVLDERLLDVSSERGEEISVLSESEETVPSLVRILQDHTKGANFRCTMKPTYALAKRWLPLATNKYGRPVAGTICPQAATKGWVVILHHVADLPNFLLKLLGEALPDMVPHLFPHLEGARWVQGPEYELPKIIELKARIYEVQENTRKQVAVLEDLVAQERLVAGYLHELITESGRPLVSAVKKTLETLGFQKVVDVDEEATKAGDKERKREDLRVHDDSPILLMEVTGISTLPSEAKAIQVWKYLAPRMKQWDRTDLQGLEIVNHQRNLPGLQRENENPFSQDVLTNANEHGFGLMTSWDLFRLARSYLANGWRHEHVRPLFYQVGRIYPVPIHYQFIGVVERLWEKPSAVGVRVHGEELRVGDHIAFELPVQFEEQVVESLEADRKAVEEVGLGGLAGIRTHLRKEQLKTGVRVFRAVGD